MSPKKDKPKVEDAVNMERTEMQPIIRAALVEQLKGMNLTPTVEHARRLMRVLLREAAKIGLTGGCPPNAFAGMAYESLVKEAHGAEDGGIVDAIFTFKSTKGEAS